MGSVISQKKHRKLCIFTHTHEENSHFLSPPFFSISRSLYLSPSLSTSLFLTLFSGCHSLLWTLTRIVQQAKTETRLNIFKMHPPNKIFRPIPPAPPAPKRPPNSRGTLNYLLLYSTYICFGLLSADVDPSGGLPLFYQNMLSAVIAAPRACSLFKPSRPAGRLRSRCRIAIADKRSRTAAGLGLQCAATSSRSHRLSPSPLPPAPL
jgi:hypothetical protein